MSTHLRSYVSKNEILRLCTRNIGINILVRIEKWGKRLLQMEFMALEHC